MRSPKERKTCLKRALQQTLVLKEAINDSTVNKLDEAINEVDNVANETSIEEKVWNQQEVLFDSQMMTSSSIVLKTCTVTLTKRMRDYNYVDFAQKLVKHLQETSDDIQPTNWSLLETHVTKLFKRIPDYNTLLGTLQPLEKKAKIRKKPESRIAQQAKMIVPDKLVLHGKEEDSVERTVRKIRKLIVCCYKETRQPLDLFRLILHPDDFGRTIRNLLYVSFLVKDGVVKLGKGDHGSLIVQPFRKEMNSQEKRSDNRTAIQNVISLNMEQWKVLNKAYKVEQPMIDFDEGN